MACQGEVPLKGRGSNPFTCTFETDKGTSKYPHKEALFLIFFQKSPTSIIKSSICQMFAQEKIKL